MGDQVSTATVFDLEGTGIRLRYRSHDAKLDLSGDDGLLNHDDLDVVVAVDTATGLRLTATLLESSRNGTKVMLTVLLPQLESLEESHEPCAVTGVAIMTKLFERVINRRTPVLQSYANVWKLEGTAT